MDANSQRGAERRTERRLQPAVTLHAEMRGDDLPAASGGMIVGSVQEISAHGLRLQCPLPLPAGSTLHLHVRSVDRSRSFLLWGRVCWVLHASDGDYEAGLNVGAETAGELQHWVRWVDDAR